VLRRHPTRRTRDHLLRSKPSPAHRREEFRSSRIMLERAQRNDKIRFRMNTAVVEVLGEGSVSGLCLRDTTTGEENTLAVTAMFVAVGHDPRSELIATS